MSARRRWVLAILTVVAVGALGYVIWSAWDHQALLAWMRQARPLPFFIAMAILPAFGIPPTPLYVIAGATFGVRVGLIGSLAALATNVTISYWLARLMRPRLQSLMRRFRYELPHFGDKRRSAFRFTAAVKLAPGVPAFVKNYGLGVARVPYLLFLGLSMIINGAYAAALVLLGESLLEHQRERAGYIVAIAIAVGAALLVRRRARPQPGGGAAGSSGARSGGAMNSGPTGSRTLCAMTPSI